MPELDLPAYCKDEAVLTRLHEEWSKPLQYPMHPCNFLRQPPRLPAWERPLWNELGRIRARQQLQSLL